MQDLPTFRNWQLEINELKFLWITLDKQESHINTINTEVLTELAQIINFVNENKEIKALAIRSFKPNGFAAGADIQQLRNVSTFEEAYALINQGQTVFKQLASLEIPTLALIHGYCLGGGLEMALACRYRVALLDPKTKLGLPEVMLGVHPGWGGTVRLPRLIGGSKALDLILSGRSVGAKEAAKLGMVDAAVQKWDEERAVIHYLVKTPPQRQPKGLDRLSNLDFVRPLLAKLIRKKLEAKVNRLHYPAPYAALENWVKYGVSSDEAFEIEARSIAQLMITDTTQNLVRVFNLQERLKSQPRDTSYKASRVHVVGAGVMGGDIAAWCAFKGLEVTLYDQDTQAMARAFERALKLFTRSLKEPHLIMAARDRLRADLNSMGIHAADVIIEAIIEKKDAKDALFANLGKTSKPDALLASNTSTIPLEEIAENTQNKSRVLGIHFFNPVSRMQLVEVVCPSSLDDQKKDQAVAFVRSIDKLPLIVKSSPGFLVNRVLMPYLLESLQLLDEGLPEEAIDKIIEDFGMPMGPIELMDNVGVDVCLYSMESLGNEIEPLKQALQGSIGKRLRSMVEQKRLGKKTGRGFYIYKNGKPLKKHLGADYRVPEDALDRMILRMINEAIACLREKIVEDADLLDAGMIFGTGFAPFRGGPIHYVLEQGEGLMLQRLNLLVQRYGSRFEPDPGWGMLDAV